MGAGDETVGADEGVLAVRKGLLAAGGATAGAGVEAITAGEEVLAEGAGLVEVGGKGVGADPPGTRARETPPTGVGRLHAVTSDGTGGLVTGTPSGVDAFDPAVRGGDVGAGAAAGAGKGLSRPGTGSGAGANDEADGAAG